MKKIGLINPGEMGTSVGAATQYSGNKVIWASIGRSNYTKKRAKKAGFKSCNTIEELAYESDIILSICPPSYAEDIANQVADTNFKGLYLEANAISPFRTRKIKDILKLNGCTMVDGSIIGIPAWEINNGTVLYLSGYESKIIADLFRSSPLKTKIISEKIGAASAIKMAFAAYTKGTTALLSAILAMAEKEGIRKNLEIQWGNDFTNKTHHEIINNSYKAWRFEGEMNEIADTFFDLNLPDGFHRASAEIFKRMSGFKNNPKDPLLLEVLQALLDTDKDNLEFHEVV